MILRLLDDHGVAALDHDGIGLIYAHVKARNFRIGACRACALCGFQHGIWGKA